jgi:hypothetical protein
VPVSDLCLAGGLVFNIHFCRSGDLIFFFAFAANLLLKAFRPLGEILSFALPKESIQRKGNPIPLDSACAEQL